MLKTGHKTMEILVRRRIKTQLSTLSSLSINGDYECCTIEDKDRGLKSTMALLTIKALKIFGETAIPTGRYRVIISYSPHFKKYLPEILNVPGYAGIRIHAGNTAADTEGCLIVGTEYKSDSVINSRMTLGNLMMKLESVEKTEEIWITIS